MYKKNCSTVKVPFSLSERKENQSSPVFQQKLKYKKQRHTRERKKLYTLLWVWEARGYLFKTPAGPSVPSALCVPCSHGNYHCTGKPSQTLLRQVHHFDRLVAAQVCGKFRGSIFRGILRTIQKLLEAITPLAPKVRPCLS